MSSPDGVNGWGLWSRARVWLAAIIALIAILGAWSSKPQPAEAALLPCTVIALDMTAPTCALLRSDTAAHSDPKAGLWGSVDCAAATRHRFVATDGDPKLTAQGLPQLNTSYRALTVLDGDDFAGERCELGRNERRNGENTGQATAGTFALYREGQRRITFFSERYRNGFAFTDPRWQTVAQMKQTQPADAGSGVPIVELQIRDGKLFLDTPIEAKWSTPAPAAGTWVHYALDVVYSTSATTGSVQVYVDKNGDNDALDPGEQSPVISMQTLKPEGPGTSADGLAEGAAIPSHLRLGIYHDPGYACPSPGGCTVEVDNVQVVGP